MQDRKAVEDQGHALSREDAIPKKALYARKWNHVLRTATGQLQYCSVLASNMRGDISKYGSSDARTNLNAS